MSQRRPKIGIMGCGGTISSLGTSSLDLVDCPEFGEKMELTARRGYSALTITPFRRFAAAISRASAVTKVQRSRSASAR
jgi:hypothetical protein